MGDSRFVVERINRELRIAIPNSARVKTDSAGSIQCLEFVPAEWVSFYTSLSVLPALTTSANIVEFANNAANFSLEVNDFAIVYPTSNSNGNVFRIEDTIDTTQTVYTSGTLMAENLKNDFTNIDEAPFRIYDATLTRNGLVHILLAFERNEEIINYSSEVHIPNVP